MRLCGHEGSLLDGYDPDVSMRCLFFRDLLKWCSRIVRDFDVSKSATAITVFQEALDCFVVCLPRVEKRLPVAEAIGAKLNINKLTVRVKHEGRRFHSLLFAVQQ